MKIVHVLTTNKASGAEKIAIDIIEKLDKEHEIYYCSPNGSISDILEKKGIRYLPIKKISFFNLKQVFDFISPDIIHAHDFKASVFCSFFYKKSKIISHIHHTPTWYSKKNFKSLIYYLRSSKFSWILTVSNQTKEKQPFKLSIPNGKILNIGNPISYNNIINLAEEFEICDEYDIIFIGRLSPEKQPILFVEIIKKIQKRIPNIKVCMVGEGILESDIKNSINDYKLKENIFLKGYLDNPYPYIKNSKIMVSTSTREGFGLSIVEGLVLSTPVIAFDIDGISRFVTTEVGKLVTDSDEMIVEIIELLENKNYFSEKKRNCEIVSPKFNNDKDYIQNIKKVYEI